MKLKVLSLPKSVFGEMELTAFSSSMVEEIELGGVMISGDNTGMPPRGPAGMRPQQGNPNGGQPDGMQPGGQPNGAGQPGGQPGGNSPEMMMPMVGGQPFMGMPNLKIIKLGLVKAETPMAEQKLVSYFMSLPKKELIQCSYSISLTQLFDMFSSYEMIVDNEALNPDYSGISRQNNLKKIIFRNNVINWPANLAYGDIQNVDLSQAGSLDMNRISDELLSAPRIVSLTINPLQADMLSKKLKKDTKV
jgi:hypothetical protein